MATRVEVVKNCDICGTEELVNTHTVRLDKKTVDAEACDPCWGDVETTLTPLLKAGREEAPRKRIRKPRQQK